MRYLLLFFLSIGMASAQPIIRSQWTTNVDGKPKNAVAINPTFYSDLSHVTLTLFPAIGQNTDIFRLMDVTNGSIRKVWVDQNYMLWAAGGITGTGGTFTAWSAYAIPGQTDNVWAVYGTNGVIADYAKSNGTFTATSLGVGGDGENAAANSSLLLYGTNSSGQSVIYRFTSTNSLFRIDSSVNGATYGNSMTYSSGGILTLNSGTTTIDAVGTITAHNYLGDQTTSSIQAGDGGAHYWGSRSQVRSSADGLIELFNTANTGFTRLDFGGTTATFPAWKVNGAGFTLTGADGTSNSTNSLTIPGPIDAGSITNRGALTNGGRFINLSAFQLQTNTPALTGTGTTNFIIDCSLGNVFNLFPTANFKLWLTNSYSGFQGWINIVQDGGGSRLWIYDVSNIRTNASLILSTAANAVDRIDMRSDTKGTNVQFTLQKNFQ